MPALRITPQTKSAATFRLQHARRRLRVAEAAYVLNCTGDGPIRATVRETYLAWHALVDRLTMLRGYLDRRDGEEAWYAAKLAIEVTGTYAAAMDRRAWADARLHLRAFRSFWELRGGA